MNPRCSLLLRNARSSRRSPRGVRRHGRPRRILHTTWIEPSTSGRLSGGTVERREVCVASRAGRSLSLLRVTSACLGNDNLSCRELFVFMQLEVPGAHKSFATSHVFSNDFNAGRSHQSHSPSPPGLFLLLFS